jgi:hypothetical protein
MERMRARLTRVAVPAVVALAVLAPLVVHWLSGRTLAWFDTQSLYAPQRWIVDESLRAFRLPLWNPFMGAGMPFLADSIHGVLHPVSILTAWLRTDRGADVLVGGYVTCAGLGAALLARDLGASRAGAAVAAVAFGTSGFVLSMAGNLVFLAGAGTLPFCVAGLRRLAVDPRPSSLAFGVGGVAALAFSGDVQSLMVGGALALALSWEAGGWRGAVRAVAAGTVGLLVAGVQLLPAAVHLPRTIRGAETWASTPHVWAFEPWRIPELIVPGILRGSDPMLDRVYEGLAGPGHWPGGLNPMPFAAGVFVGVLPVVFAITGAREGRRGKVLAALALVLLWIALGPALGADAALRWVPVWSAFRYSEKLVGALTLVVAVLAAIGLDAVVEERVSGWRVFGAAVALGLASIGVCLLSASSLAPELASVADARVARGAWHVLGAVLALAGWLLVRGRLGATGSRGALAVVACAAVAVASPLALHPGDPDARLRSPGPVLEAKEPGPRIVTPFTREPISTEPGLDWLDQAGRVHASLGNAAYNVRSRLDSLSDYEAMTPGRLARLRSAFGAQWSAASRRYAGTHVVAARPLTASQQASLAIAASGGERLGAAAGQEIWAVPHREWASFPLEVRVVADERAAVLATVDAFVAQSGAVVVEASSRFDVAPGRVLSIERGLEALRVEAEADADATLVIADAWWPGWEATIDGWSVSIFPADGLVRAVRWPAGRHVLVMRYRPPEVRTGLWVSALGLGVLGVWIASMRRKRAPHGLEHG